MHQFPAAITGFYTFLTLRKTEEVEIDAIRLRPLLNMSCKRSNKDSEPLVDIERLLVDYAWKNLVNKGSTDKLLGKRRYVFEVNRHCLRISQQLVSFGGRTKNDPSSSRCDNANHKVVSRNFCLFSAVFRNSSDTEQTFAFKTERKTTSRYEVSIQRGFRLGGKVDVRLSIPVIPVGAVGKDGKGQGFSVTGGLSAELHVTKTTGQSFEDVLTWSVDNQIKVSKNSTTEAKLTVMEEEFVADFSVEHVIQADTDIPVYMKDKTNGSILRTLEIPRDSLDEILAAGKGIELEEGRHNMVKCLTEGTVSAIYGVRQVIDVKTYNEIDYSQTPSTEIIIEEIE